MDIGAVIRQCRKPKMGRRLIVLCLATTVMGFCVAMFDKLGTGADPCSTMNLGISRLLGISFGTWQMMLNAAMFLYVIRKDKSKIGPGTVANMVFVGYIAEAFMHVIAAVQGMAELSLMMRAVLFVPTMLLFLAAVAFYLVVDLGSGPYDAIPMIIAANQRKYSFRTIRICWDVSVIVIGYVVGSTIGIATLITGFCLGPAVASISEKVSHWFEE